MVPEGWSELKIGAVCSEIIDCVNKTAKVVSETTSFKMIRTTNVRNGRVDTENVRYVSEETFRIWTRRGKLRRGDIILTREAPVGEVGQLLDAEGMFLGQRTMLYRADPKKMVQSFLFQIMISPALQEQYKAASAGGTVHHIRVPDCSKFIVSVPPLPEQQKIAEILSTWDKAIETTEALLANARTQKRALMQSLLTGTRRFPGFADQPWREVWLREVCYITVGKAKRDELVDDGNKLILDMGAVSRVGEIVARKRTNSTDDQLIYGDLVMPKDDIGGGNIIGKVVLVDKDNRYVLGDHVYLLRVASLKTTSPKFLRYQINGDRVNRTLRRKANGTAQLGLGRKDVERQTVLLPCLAEQDSTVEVLDAAQNEIDHLAAQLDHLRTEKKSLMQQLLTGKRRVVV